MSDTCVLCGSSKHHLLCRKNAFDIVRCVTCNLVRVYPLPSEEQLEKYYAHNYDQFKYSLSSPHSNPPKRKMRGLKLLERHCTGRKLLDVGSAYGHFMQNALIHGWEVEGVEPLEQGRVRSMTKLGLRVHDTIGHAPINAFDAVTMWHVIEHIGSPIEFLQEVRATLVDGGVLALATPNIESLVARATGESWSWLSPPDHLYFYSPKTLPELLLKSGFEVLEVRTRRGQSRNTLLLLLQAVAYRMGVFHSMKSSIERAAYETRTSRSIARKVNIFWMIEMVTEGLSALGVPILFLIWKLGLGDEVLAFARKK